MFDKRRKMHCEEIRVDFCPRCTAQTDFCGCIEEAQRPPSILDVHSEDTRIHRGLARPNGFGYFVGHPETSWVEDGETMILLRDYSFIAPSPTEWRAKRGMRLVGASIPRTFWAYAAPYNGRYRRASILHDYYCVTRERPHESVHFMFYRGMRANGVESLKAKFFYYAVKHFGPKWGYSKTSKGNYAIQHQMIRPERLTVEVVGRIAHYIAKRNPPITEIDRQESNPLYPGLT